jgi:hypothetical protein
MMAAAAAAVVAANQPSNGEHSRVYPIKENMSKLNNDDYEAYSENEAHEADESDSNYLNRLRNHKINANGHSFHGEIKSEVMGNGRDR